MAYKGLTNAHREGNARYDKEKIDSIHLRLHKGEKERYKTAADNAGLSLNQFFVTAANEKIERDDLDEGATIASCGGMPLVEVREPSSPPLSE